MDLTKTRGVKNYYSANSLIDKTQQSTQQTSETTPNSAEDNMKVALERIQKQNETLQSRLEQLGISEWEVDKVSDNRNLLQKVLGLKENQGLIMGTLSLLGRPAEALQGALAESFTGGNIFQGMWQGLHGDKEFTLKDLGFDLQNPAINAVAGIAFESMVDPLAFLDSPLKTIMDKTKPIFANQTKKLVNMLTKDEAGQTAYNAIMKQFDTVSNFLKKTVGTWKDIAYKKFNNWISNGENKAGFLKNTLNNLLNSMNDAVNDGYNYAVKQYLNLDEGQRKVWNEALELDDNFGAKLNSANALEKEEAQAELLNKISRWMGEGVEQSYKHGYVMRDMYDDLLKTGGVLELSAKTIEDVKAGQAYRAILDAMEFAQKGNPKFADFKMDELLQVVPYERARQFLGSDVLDGHGNAITSIGSRKQGFAIVLTDKGKELFAPFWETIMTNRFMKHAMLKNGIENSQQILTELVTKSAVTIAKNDSESMKMLKDFQTMYKNAFGEELYLIHEEMPNNSFQVRFAPNKEAYDRIESLDRQIKQLGKIKEQYGPAVREYEGLLNEKDAAVWTLNTFESSLKQMIYDNPDFLAKITNADNKALLEGIEEDILGPFRELLKQNGIKDLDSPRVVMQAPGAPSQVNVDRASNAFKDLITYGRMVEDTFKGKNVISIDGFTFDFANACDTGRDLFIPLKVEWTKMDWAKRVNFIAYCLQQGATDFDELAELGIRSFKDLRKPSVAKRLEEASLNLDISLTSDPERNSLLNLASFLDPIDDASIYDWVTLSDVTTNFIDAMGQGLFTTNDTLKLMVDKFGEKALFDFVNKHFDDLDDAMQILVTGRNTTEAELKVINNKIRNMEKKGIKRKQSINKSLESGFSADEELPWLSDRVQELRKEYPDPQELLYTVNQSSEQLLQQSMLGNARIVELRDLVKSGMTKLKQSFPEEIKFLDLENNGTLPRSFKRQLRKAVEDKSLPLYAYYNEAGVLQLSNKIPNLMEVMTVDNVAYKELDVGIREALLDNLNNQDLLLEAKKQTDLINDAAFELDYVREMVINPEMQYSIDGLMEIKRQELARMSNGVYENMTVGKPVDIVSKQTKQAVQQVQDTIKANNDTIAELEKQLDQLDIDDAERRKQLKTTKSKKTKTLNEQEALQKEIDLVKEFITEQSKLIDEIYKTPEDFIGKYGTSIESRYADILEGIAETQAKNKADKLAQETAKPVDQAEVQNAVEEAAEKAEEKIADTLVEKGVVQTGPTQFTVPETLANWMNQKAGDVIDLTVDNLTKQINNLEYMDEGYTDLIKNTEKELDTYKEELKRAEKAGTDWKEETFSYKKDRPLHSNGTRNFTFKHEGQQRMFETILREEGIKFEYSAQNPNLVVLDNINDLVEAEEAFNTIKNFKKYMETYTPPQARSLAEIQDDINLVEANLKSFKSNQLLAKSTIKQFQNELDILTKPVEELKEAVTGKKSKKKKGKKSYKKKKAETTAKPKEDYSKTYGEGWYKKEYEYTTKKGKKRKGKKLVRYNEDMDYTKVSHMSYMWQQFYRLKQMRDTIKATDPQNIQEIKKLGAEIGSQMGQIMDLKGYAYYLMKQKSGGSAAKKTLDAQMKELNKNVKEFDKLIKQLEVKDATSLAKKREELRDQIQAIKDTNARLENRAKELTEPVDLVVGDTQFMGFTDNLAANITNPDWVPIDPLSQASTLNKIPYIQRVRQSVKWLSDLTSHKKDILTVQNAWKQIPGELQEAADRFINVQQTAWNTIVRAYKEHLGIDMSDWGVDGYMRHILNPENATLQAAANTLQRRLIGTNAEIFGKNLTKVMRAREYQASAADIERAFGIELFNTNPVQAMMVAMDMSVENFKVANLFKNAMEYKMITPVDMTKRQITKEGLDDLIERTTREIEELGKNTKLDPKLKEKTLAEKTSIVDAAQRFIKIFDEHKEFLDKYYAVEKQLKDNQPIIDEIKKRMDSLKTQKKFFEEQNWMEDAVRAQLELAQANEEFRPWKELMEQVGKQKEEVIKENNEYLRKLDELLPTLEKAQIGKWQGRDTWLRNNEMFGPEWQWVDAATIGELKQVYKLVEKMGGEDVDFEAIWHHQMDEILQAVENNQPYAIHKGMLEHLKNFSRQTRNPEFKAIWDTLQRWVVGPFKKLSVMSVGFHVRNFMTNFVNGYLAGINPQDLAQGMSGVRQELKVFDEILESLNTHLATGKYRTVDEQIKLLDEIILLDPKKRAIWEDYMDMLNRGIIGNNMFNPEIANMLLKIRSGTFGTASTQFSPLTFGKIGKMVSGRFEKLMQSSFKYSKMIDDLAKVSMYRLLKDPKYAHLLEKTGMDADRYLKFVLFDYNDLTHTEQTVLKTIFPFYTWMKKNLEFQLKNFAINNKRYRRLYAGLKGWKSGVIEDEENSPEYYDNYIPIWNANGKITYLKLTMPYQDADELISGEGLINALSPVIKQPLEMITGYDFFTQRELGKHGITRSLTFGMSNWFYTASIVYKQLFEGYNPTYEDKKLAGILGKKVLNTITMTKNLFSIGTNLQNDGMVHTITGLVPSMFAQADITNTLYYNAKRRQEELQKAVQYYTQRSK